MDLLDVAWHSSTRGKSEKEVQEVQQILVCDISQGVERSPWHTMVPTFTTSGEYYMFGPDRLIEEPEKLSALGFDKVNLEGLSTSEVKDLAGEAMALPSIGSILIAVIMAADFPDLFVAS